MGEVTRAEFEELRKTVDETYWIVRTLAKAHAKGEEEFDRFIASVERFCDPKRRRERAGTPLSGLGLNLGRNDCGIYRFWEADIVTLEEVAERRRDEIAEIPDIGRVSLQRLEAAMAERGLGFAEAV